MTAIDITNYLKMISTLENEGKGICSFVLKHGQAWSAHPTKERSPIKRGPVKQCFANSQKTLVTLLQQGKDDAFFYVEGFAVANMAGVGLPVLHAWLVDSQGRVYDPTWIEAEKNDYFGVPFNSEYVFARIEKDALYHSLIDHFPSRWELIRNPSTALDAVMNWERHVSLSPGPAALR